MAGLILQVFLDSIMALLLIVTAVYCWRLNARIKVLQDSKSELAGIIKEFDSSTQRATQSIAEIHEATARIAENMQHKIDKANYIADDLQFMIEKGGKLAGRGDMEVDRDGGGSARSGRGSGDAKVEPLKRGSSKRSAGEESLEVKSNKGRTSIDSMLKRVRSGSAEEPAESVEDAGTSRSRRQGARLRSKAEQELFEALKSGGGKG